MCRRRRRIVRELEGVWRRCRFVRRWSCKNLFFECRDCLFVGHGREIIQEIRQRVPCFQVIHQGLEWNAGAEKDRGAAHDFGVAVDGGMMIHISSRELGFACSDAPRGNAVLENCTVGVYRSTPGGMRYHGTRENKRITLVTTLLPNLKLAGWAWFHAHRVIFRVMLYTTSQPDYLFLG